MAWLRARYADPVTWREVGYAVLLATVAPVLSAAALFAVPLAAVLIAGPFLVLAQQPGSSPVALVFGTVATVRPGRALRDRRRSGAPAAALPADAGRGRAGRGGPCAAGWTGRATSCAPS